VEADLIILTAVLHFSGGVVNPFYLFYVFHIIIATIILPRNLSFAVGLTAILLFGLLAVNELNAGSWLGYHPLQFSAGGGFWRNPVYALGAFVAFTCMVVLAQYLTRIIIIRMTAKELEAAQNRDVLEAVISAMAEGLIFITREGRIAICNPAADAWKRKEKGEERGDPFEQFPPVLAEHMRGLIAGSAEATGGATTIEFKTKGPRERDIETVSCPVVGFDGQALGYVIVGQDLTEHKKLEKDLLRRTDEVARINEMLKISQIEMAQREKMVAIGQMATGIAHEIGNPLASLSSVVQYLGRKLTKAEEQEHLSVMEHHVHRISGILKRMLGVSRPAAAEHKWVDVNELIGNALSLIGFDRRARSVTFKNTVNDELPMVWLNPHHLEQVFLNVFINALDAMSAKEGDGENVLEVTRQLKDGMIEICCRDTGVGMNPEVCSRAFESFFTTKEAGKGTGLGLFVCRNLVAEVDGTMAIESEEGRGTTVTIRIPVKGDADTTDGDGRKAEYGGPKRSKERLRQ
jgi:signal transduction histidine kinase